MGFTRRDALRLGVMGTGGILSTFGWGKGAIAAQTPPCTPHSMGESAAPLQPIRFSPKDIPIFERPFHPMQVLASKSVTPDLDGYVMTMKKTEVEILRHQKTTVWTYDGQLPGPLIRNSNKCKGSVIRFMNQLGADDKGRGINTSIHLHGVSSYPQYDGYAEDLIPDQHYKDYYYPNDKAATFWYHDHAIQYTSRNVYMGLAGMYIVEYDADDFFNPKDQALLPQGEFDIPLIIQDKRLTPEGELLFNDRGQKGVYGDVVLVNGVPWPRLEVKNRKYRFRILNGGTSRTLNLGARVKGNDGSLKQPLTLHVVASDSGLLSQPVPTQTLRLGVAERYEVVIDFADYAGQEIVLVNPIGFGNQDGDLSTTQVMCFQIRGGAQDNPPLPERLGQLTPIETLLSEVKGPVRTFRFDQQGGRWVINGKTWDPQRVDAHVPPCATEIWRFVNPGGGWVHPVHVHLGHFRLIRRSRTAIADYERGMKDTFFVNEVETVEMIGRFGPHEGKYMMHCHNLVHEDHDMMTQFEVGSQGCSPCSEPASPLPAPAEFDPPSCVPPQECMVTEGGNTSCV